MALVAVAAWRRWPASLAARRLRGVIGKSAALAAAATGRRGVDSAVAAVAAWQQGGSGGQRGSGGGGLRFSGGMLFIRVLWYLFWVLT